MKLYSNPTSWFAIPCKIALAESGKDYEEQIINYADGSNMSGDYSINPNRTVPTLVDEDVVLTESLDILKHAAQYQDSLYPQELQGEIDEFCRLFYAIDTTKLIYGWMGSKGMAGNASRMVQKRIEIAKNLISSDSEHADVWRQKVVENQARLQALENPSTALPGALAQCRQLVSRCNSQLAKGAPYLFGDRFTIADCLMASALTRLEEREQGNGGLWGEGKNYRIASYIAALKDRPSVNKSLPKSIASSNQSSLQFVRENPVLYLAVALATISIFVALRQRQAD
jgi:glutathione S-transferase